MAMTLTFYLYTMTSFPTPEIHLRTHFLRMGHIGLYTLNCTGTCVTNLYLHMPVSCWHSISHDIQMFSVRPHAEQLKGAATCRYSSQGQTTVDVPYPMPVLYRSENIKHTNHSMKFNTGKTDVMFKQYYLQILCVQDFTASAPELFYSWLM